MSTFSSIPGIDLSQPCTPLEKQVELLSDAFIADNVRAKNLGIPKQVLTAQVNNSPLISWKLI